MDNLLAKVKERRLPALSRGNPYVSEDSKTSENLLAKVRERRLPALSRGNPYVSEDSKTSKENSGSTPSNSSVPSMISL